MLAYLIDLTDRLGHWGYVVLFLGAMAESAAFLGLFIPGETLVLVAGFFAAQGALQLDDVIVTVAAGATLGDSLGYQFGCRLGREWLLSFGPRFGLRESRLQRVDAFFTRHGGKAVFLGRFIGFARALVPFLAGASRMRYRQFLPYNVLGAVLWAVVVASLGYFLGSSWQVAERWIGRTTTALAVMLIIIVSALWLWRRTVHRD